MAFISINFRMFLFKPPEEVANACLQFLLSLFLFTAIWRIVICRACDDTVCIIKCEEPKSLMPFLNLFFQISRRSRRKPLNEVGSQDPVEHISGIRTGNIPNLNVTYYPTMLLSPLYSPYIWSPSKFSIRLYNIYIGDMFYYNWL